MTFFKSRIELLEKEQRFQRWLSFSRFLESLSEEQLEDIAIHWRFPEPLPEPLPFGASELDKLDRKALIKLWEESEREISRIMRDQRGRNEQDLRFHLHHWHWPEQACTQGCPEIQRKEAMHHDENSEPEKANEGVADR
jgi:hypothetical protein